MSKLHFVSTEFFTFSLLSINVQLLHEWDFGQWCVAYNPTWSYMIDIIYHLLYKISESESRTTTEMRIMGPYQLWRVLIHSTIRMACEQVDRILLLLLIFAFLLSQQLLYFQQQMTVLVDDHYQQLIDLVIAYYHSRATKRSRDTDGPPRKKHRLEEPTQSVSHQTLTP